MLEDEPPGLTEAEMEQSLANLKLVAEKCEACASEIRRRHEEHGVLCELLVRKESVREWR